VVGVTELTLVSGGALEADDIGALFAGLVDRNEVVRYDERLALRPVADYSTRYYVVDEERGDHLDVINLDAVPTAVALVDRLDGYRARLDREADR